MKLMHALSEAAIDATPTPSPRSRAAQWGETLWALISPPVIVPLVCTSRTPFARWFLRCLGSVLHSLVCTARCDLWHHFDAKEAFTVSETIEMPRTCVWNVLVRAASTVRT